MSASYSGIVNAVLKDVPGIGDSTLILSITSTPPGPAELRVHMDASDVKPGSTIGINITDPQTRTANQHQ